MAVTQDDKFWLVLQKQGRFDNKQYKTKIEAVNAATRLVEKTRAAHYVLESIHLLEFPLLIVDVQDVI